MATTVTRPLIFSGTPSVTNTGDEVQISVPIVNRGVEASRVFVTDITLGSARRTSPAAFPVLVGDLANGATGSASARFANVGLVTATSYLLTVRGTYGGRTPPGFTLSRYVVIPAPRTDGVILFKSHVEVAVQPATWNYTLINDETTGSNLYLFAFSLDIAAPISVTSTPPGWKVETDLLSYVGWHATGLDAKNSSHIAPGKRLGGFQIHGATAQSESTPYVLASWDHSIHQAGAVNIDEVLSPRRGG